MFLIITRVSLAAALLIGALAGASRASASVTTALSLEELTGRADDVWLARCVRSASRYDEQGRIVTDLTLAVDDSMKGRRRAGEQAEMTVLGGVVGDVGMQVPGEAHLAVGDEAIVFLRTGRDGRRHAVGMSQGVLPVRRGPAGPMVHPGASGLHLVPSTPGSGTARATGAIEEARPLGEMVSRIRSIVVAQRAGSLP